MKIIKIHKYFLIFLALIFCCSCKPNPKTISLPARQYFTNNLKFPDTTYVLELTYIGMGCPCPQWATEKNIKLYESASFKIPMDSLFVTIVEEDGYEQNPFELVAWRNSEAASNTFIFEGRLSDNKFKWQGEDGNVWENRVFQYSNCKYRPTKKKDK